MCDGSNAVPAALHILPGIGSIVSQRSDRTDSGDDNSSVLTHHIFSLRGDITADFILYMVIPPSTFSLHSDSAINFFPYMAIPPSTRRTSPVTYSADAR